MKYIIQRAAAAPALDGEWESEVWRRGDVVSVDRFHPQSSGHRPVTEARVLYDDEALYVSFRVRDRYVRCVHMNYQDSVCRDSCAEFFVQPDPARGYFNFEINCGGTMLLYYVTDATRTAGGDAAKVEVDAERAATIEIYHSLSGPIEEEIVDPTTWSIQYRVPFGALEHYAGPVSRTPGTEWRGNFYKCGDQTSHPHWASWAPIGEVLNFHKPECFAPLVFGPP